MPQTEVNEREEESQQEPRGEVPPPPRRRGLFQRHPRAKWILGVIVVVLVVGGILFWLHERVRETTDDAQITGDIVPVAARVNGTVLQVRVDDNQEVKKGDVLVQLDPRDYQVALEKAQADLANAQAKASAARTGVPISSASATSNLAVARANLAAAQKEVAATEARLAEANTKHQLAMKDEQRFKQLLAKDEVSQQQYDTAATNEASLRAAVDAAQADVATAQSHVAQAQAQVRAAQTAPEQIVVTRSQAGAAAADVQTQQAALDQAKLNLEYCTVRAAVDGVVTRKTVEPGQTVQAGQPLMALVPLEGIWVVANYKENQLHNMRVGQPATIHVDTYDRDYKGHVNSIAAASAALTSLLPPENATGNFVKVVQRIPVKITFDKGQDPNHLLRPGMSVEPTVLTNR
jgi:membrane fusion protein (multidrug efflux system)